MRKCSKANWSDHPKRMHMQGCCAKLEVNQSCQCSVQMCYTCTCALRRQVPASLSTLLGVHQPDPLRLPLHLLVKELLPEPSCEACFELLRVCCPSFRDCVCRLRQAWQQKVNAKFGLSPQQCWQPGRLAYCWRSDTARLCKLRCPAKRMLEACSRPVHTYHHQAICCKV